MTLNSSVAVTVKTLPFAVMVLPASVAGRLAITSVKVTLLRAVTGVKVKVLPAFVSVP